jgi:diketogulonate reductase-like aldo/keto reductase
LHWPVNGRLEAWQDLIRAHEAGKVRSIGVSNFTAEHIEELIDATSVVPALNQIEFHPYLTQTSISEVCRQHRIAVEAWSPLMQGEFLRESLFSELAETYNRTQAQIVLRWDIQRGVITIPKSITPDRIEENFHIFDFTLSDEDMSRIDALECNRRLGPDPENFDF